MKTEKQVCVVCSNLIVKDGKFLLVKETKPSAKGLYSLPSGRMELDETLVEGVVREAREESGLKVKPRNIIGIYQEPDSKKGNNYMIFIFESEVIGGKIKTSKIHPEVKFFSYDEILELKKKNLLRSNNIVNSIARYKKGVRIELSNLIMQ